jgi:hypothetical protein
LPYTALADQKHGRRQCQHAWEGPQHAQKAKFLNLQFEDRGKIKLKVTFSGNIVELNLKKARIRILPFDVKGYLFSIPTNSKTLLEPTSPITLSTLPP